MLGGKRERERGERERERERREGHKNRGRTIYNKFRGLIAYLHYLPTCWLVTDHLNVDFVPELSLLINQPPRQ